jgi:hypothetical protein
MGQPSAKQGKEKANGVFVIVPIGHAARSPANSTPTKGLRQPAWLGDGASSERKGMSRARPHDIGRTERAPPADLLGCVCACAAAGLNWSRRGKSLRCGGHSGGGQLPVAR